MLSQKVWTEASDYPHSHLHTDSMRLVDDAHNLSAAYALLLLPISPDYCPQPVNISVMCNVRYKWEEWQWTSNLHASTNFWEAYKQNQIPGLESWNLCGGWLCWQNHDHIHKILSGLFGLACCILLMLLIYCSHNTVLLVTEIVLIARIRCWYLFKQDYTICYWIVLVPRMFRKLTAWLYQCQHISPQSLIIFAGILLSKFDLFNFQCYCYFVYLPFSIVS